MTLPGKSLLLAVTVLVGAGVGLLLLARDSSRRAPTVLHIAAEDAAPATGPAPQRIQELFSPGALPRLGATTNGTNPFYTAYFQPPPAPPPKTTRKVELTYQGFFETKDGSRQAFLRVGTNILTGTVGKKVIAEYAIAQIEHGTLTLTNGTSEPAVIGFRAKKELEIPVE
jgi:hypothetical protein